MPERNDDLMPDPRELLPEIDRTQWDYRLPVGQFRDLFSDLASQLEDARKASNQLASLEPVSTSALSNILFQGHQMMASLQQDLAQSTQAAQQLASQLSATAIQATQVGGFSSAAIAQTAQQAAAVAQQAVASPQSAIIQATQATQQFTSTFQQSLMAGTPIVGQAIGTMQSALIQAAQSVQPQPVYTSSLVPPYQPTFPEQIGYSLIKGLTSLGVVVGDVTKAVFSGLPALIGGGIGAEIGGPIGAIIGSAVLAPLGDIVGTGLDAMIQGTLSPLYAANLDILFRNYQYAAPLAFAGLSPGRLAGFSLERMWEGWVRTGQMMTPADIAQVLDIGLRTGRITGGYGMPITAETIETNLESMLQSINRLIQVFHMKFEQAAQLVGQLGPSAGYVTMMGTGLGTLAPSGQIYMGMTIQGMEAARQLGLPEQWGMQIFGGAAAAAALNQPFNVQEASQLAQLQSSFVVSQLLRLRPFAYGAMGGAWGAFTAGEASLPEFLLSGAAGYIGSGTPGAILASNILSQVTLPAEGAERAVMGIARWAGRMMGVNMTDPTMLAAYIQQVARMQGQYITSEQALKLAINIQTSPYAQYTGALASMQYYQNFGVMDQIKYGMRRLVYQAFPQNYWRMMSEFMSDVHTGVIDWWQRITHFGFLGYHYISGLRAAHVLTPVEQRILQRQLGYNPMEEASDILIGYEAIDAATEILRDYTANTGVLTPKSVARIAGLTGRRPEEFRDIDDAMQALHEWAEEQIKRGVEYTRASHEVSERVHGIVQSGLLTAAAMTDDVNQRRQLTTQIIRSLVPDDKMSAQTLFMALDKLSAEGGLAAQALIEEFNFVPPEGNKAEFDKAMKYLRSAATRGKIISRVMDVFDSAKSSEEARRKIRQVVREELGLEDEEMIDTVVKSILERYETRFLAHVRDQDLVAGVYRLELGHLRSKKGIKLHLDWIKRQIEDRIGVHESDRGNLTGIGGWLREFFASPEYKVTLQQAKMVEGLLQSEKVTGIITRGDVMSELSEIGQRYTEATTEEERKELRQQAANVLIEAGLGRSEAYTLAAFVGPDLLASYGQAMAIAKGASGTTGVLETGEMTPEAAAQTSEALGQMLESQTEIARLLNETANVLKEISGRL